MSEVHRYNVVTMLSESGNRIGYDPHGPEVVMASEFDRVTAELAVLREELAIVTGQRDVWKRITKKMFETKMSAYQRAEAAEQRNAELQAIVNHHSGHIANCAGCEL